MPGPQGLSRQRVEFFGMPSSCQRRTISIARRSEDKWRYRAACRFYPAKTSPFPVGDADTHYLFPANASMSKQGAMTAMQHCHSSAISRSAQPGSGLMRTAAGAARLPPGLRGHQPGFQPATATI